MNVGDGTKTLSRSKRGVLGRLVANVNRENGEILPGLDVIGERLIT